MLAGKEREASVELVAHLAALDGRPALYAVQGYGSLFSYRVQFTIGQEPTRSFGASRASFAARSPMAIPPRSSIAP
jgi:hypothetical protein